MSEIRQSVEWILRTLPASSLEELLEKAAEIPLLTRQEEIELSWRAHAGDETAREKMLLANVRLVAKIASRFHSRKVVFFALSDLFQVGCEGLMRAVELFDERKGYRFSTYAGSWIRSFICREIQENKRPIRVPANTDTEIRRLELEREEEEARRKERVDAEEILRRREWSKGHARRVREVLQRDGEAYVNLDEPLEEDGLGKTGSVRESVASEVDVEERIIHELSVSQEVARCLSALSKKERNLIEKRFGLNGFEPHTLQELGQERGVTRERVRQIEAGVIEAMRRR